MTTQDVALTILKQLGGNKFRVMTGADKFVSNPNGVSFWIPRSNNVRKVSIVLGASDTYSVAFFSCRKVGGLPEFKTLSVHTSVYADQLQSVFTSVTGLDTHL